MKSGVLTLTGIITLACSNLAWSQSDCDKLIIKHQNWKQTPGTKWSVEITAASGGNLAYYGARHADDPADPQFTEIKALWDKAKPTLAYFEGPNRGMEDSDTLTIRKYGESGYVRLLAKQAGIKAISLEPSPAALYRYLVTRYPQEKVDIYFLLSEAMRLRTRKNYDKEKITAELETMIAKITGMLGSGISVKNITELEALYRKYWGDKGEWWQAPQQWFDPNKTTAETGGIFTNDINKLSSDYRDLHIYAQLAEQVNKGEKVIAVIGRNHVPMQEAALKCAIR